MYDYDKYVHIIGQKNFFAVLRPIMFGVLWE